MTRRLLPVDPINIAFTASTSTDFQLVNGSNGAKEYLFLTTTAARIRRGFSDVAAATTDDMLLPANSSLFLWLAPGEGVRVFSAGSGTLQIGDTSK